MTFQQEDPSLSILSARRPAAAVLALALGSLGAVAVAAPASAVVYPVVDEAGLIAAINAANASAGIADTIQISGNITLTGALPTITDDLTILGIGGTHAILAANNNALRFQGVLGDRITGSVIGLDISGAANALQATETNLTVDTVLIQTSTFPFSFGLGNLTLSNSGFDLNPGIGANITISGTDTASISDTYFNDGANGMFLTANDTAIVNVDRVTAIDNAGVGFVFRADDTGSIDASDVTATNNAGHGLQIQPTGDGEVEVDTATVTGHTATEGVWVDAQDDSRVRLIEITSTGNDGGILLNASTTAYIQLVGSSVSASTSTGIDVTSVDNSVVVIGAVSVSGTTGGAHGMLLSASDDSTQFLISMLVTGNAGGGLSVDNATGPGGGLSIVDSTFDSNGTLGSPGGGLYFDDPEQMDVYVASSTFSNNTGNSGGGVYVGAGVGTFVELAQLTISGNNANEGGGLYVQSTGVTPASIVLRHTTITDNDTNGSFGGLWFDSEDSEIYNSIISGNDGLDLGVGSLIQADYNLVGDADAGATTELNGGTGNLLGATANLGPLADNGGPTLTHRPLAGSAAINGGDPAFVIVEDFDQRGDGFPRILNGRVDIGALEVSAILAATGVAGAETAGIAGGLLLAGLAALLIAAARRRSALAQAD